MQKTQRKFSAPDKVLLFALAIAFSGCLAGDVGDPRLEQSRELVKSFGMQLKGELKKGLEDGGAVQAIRVCKNVAPQIASQISRQSGAKVSRTSLRYRNPANAPETWQADALKYLEQQATSAQAGAPLEFFTTEDDGTFRYMRAILTEGVCLACHGDVTAPALLESLQSEYPHDRAVGYELGDVRGAFSITWPPAAGN